MSLTNHPSSLVRAAARVTRMLLPGEVYRGIGDARLRSRAYRAFGIDGEEINRLWQAPRFQKTAFHLLNHRIELTDSMGGAQCLNELFFDEIYRFRAARPDPRIIDCGANVGLSIIYFKHLYPAARITAFEPDPRIFGVLEDNLRRFGFEHVTLRREAVWKETGELRFVPDGGFGGRTETGGEVPATATAVKAVRLHDFLEEPVDLLKIDIEGAETVVMEDCRDRLANVERLFVEYHGRRDEPQQLSTLLDYVREAGFRYQIKDAVGFAHPFVREERGDGVFDLQLNIFANRD